LKTNANGEIARFKEKFMAKGYSQQHGIDYNETFSPIVKFDSIITILAVAISKDLNITQFDIKTTYLYASLKKKIYMCQP
jgi:hypothetical protein